MVPILPPASFRRPKGRFDRFRQRDYIKSPYDCFESFLFLVALPV
ncbi:hypothetical protein [Azospirillum largimobile]